MPDLTYIIYNLEDINYDWKKVIFKSSDLNNILIFNNLIKDKKMGHSSAELLLSENKNIFDLDGDFSEIEKLSDGFQIKIHINSSNIKKLYLWRILLHKFNVTFVLHDSNKLKENLDKLAKLNFPIMFSYEFINNGDFIENIEDITDFYFHNEQLEIPIEPIHTLLQAWLNKSGNAFLDIYQINENKYQYINSPNQYSEAKVSYDKDLYDKCASCKSYKICGGDNKVGITNKVCEMLINLGVIFEDKLNEMQNDFT